VQFSATSQGPALERHGVCAVLNVSIGQLGALPVQFSATSQMPAAGRHGVVAGWKPLVGQVAELPVQASGTSHGPITGRHMAPAFPGEYVQLIEAPSHWSTVHGLPSLVQGEPAMALPSGGQVVPLHASATSQSPATGRHVGAGLVAVP
jgi:hypothetical protein